jgi:hypothetical protein
MYANNHISSTWKQEKPVCRVSNNIVIAIAIANISSEDQ